MAGLFEGIRQLFKAVFRKFVCGDEAEGSGVDAVAFAGGLRAVVENVAEVGIGTGAADLVADHSVGVVGADFYSGVLDGFGETGPAGAGIEFILGAEQGFTTDDGYVDTFFLVVEVFVFEGGFRAIFHGHAILHGGEFVFHGCFFW